MSLQEIPPYVPLAGAFLRSDQIMSSEKMRSNGRTHTQGLMSLQETSKYHGSEISGIFRKFGITNFSQLLSSGSPLLQKLTELVDLFVLCSMFVSPPATRSDPTL